MKIKRLFDIVASFIGLLILWPVLLVVWILLKIENRDLSPLFKQNRVGRNGEMFVICKFRTMVNNAGSMTVTAANDVRITPVGRWLRNLKLDELPELWNVLKGDMSFVGPRPDVEGYADKLIGEDRRMLKLRPGITGPATMKYRDEETLLAAQCDPVTFNDEVLYPDKVRLNLYYFDNYSLFKDLQMIVCTVLGLRMKYADEYI